MCLYIFFGTRIKIKSWSDSFPLFFFFFLCLKGKRLAWFCPTSIKRVARVWAKLQEKRKEMKEKRRGVMGSETPKGSHTRVNCRNNNWERLLNWILPPSFIPTREEGREKWFRVTFVAGIYFIHIELRRERSSWESFCANCSQVRDRSFWKEKVVHSFVLRLSFQLNEWVSASKSMTSLEGERTVRVHQYYY